MPEAEWVKLALNVGVPLAAILWLVFHTFKVWMPRQTAEFIAALNQKRQDDAALLGQQRTDFLAEIQRLHSSSVAALERQRADYLAAEEKRTQAYALSLAEQRKDHLVSMAANMEHYWLQFDQQRTTYEAHLARDREAQERQMDRLAKAIQNLGELVIYQGTETRRPDGMTATEGGKREGGRRE